jgi:hypothetical protein
LARKRWPQVAAHIGAGLRLRNKLRNEASNSFPKNSMALGVSLNVNWWVDAV